MGRSKLIRFQVNAESLNLLEPGKPSYENLKGNWSKYFNNNNEIVLELGCGRGEYTTGLANIFPNKNFIGIDVKGARLWKGSKVALESNYNHVAFLRAQIQNLENFFKKKEVSEIWITFPDPRAKDNQEKLRLTNLRFLNIYKNIMIPSGIVNFKTDNLDLFNFSLQVLKELPFEIHNFQWTNDLYNSPLLNYHYNIQTTWEKKFLDQEIKINYLRFNF